MENNEKVNKPILLEDQTATPTGLGFVAPINLLAYAGVVVAVLAVAGVAFYLGGAVAEAVYNYEVAYENQYIYTSK